MEVESHPVLVSLLFLCLGARGIGAPRNLKPASSFLACGFLMVQCSPGFL
jgi:hypothetical protein